MLSYSICFFRFIDGVPDLFFLCFFFFKQKTAYEIGVRLVGSEMCIRDRVICNKGRKWKRKKYVFEFTVWKR